MTSSWDSIRNGFLGGAAGVGGALAARYATQDPLVAGTIAASGAAYAYLTSSPVRDVVNETVSGTVTAVVTHFGEPDNPDDDRNRANLISNISSVAGIGLSVATGNPAFAYSGVAVGTAAQACRAITHRCVIL